MSSVSQSAVGVPPSSLLLVALERGFSAYELEETLHLQKPLPPTAWEDALLKPARIFFAQSGKGFRTRLVALGWELGGERDPLPPELPTIIEALHGGSLIVDDIEDNSTHRRGKPALYITHGVPLALNTGNWLYFWAFSLLLHLQLPSSIRLALSQQFGSTTLRCHFGQALDLSARLTTLKQKEIPALVAAISELKTGALMEFAISLGAAAAGAAPALADSLSAYGHDIGVALQMLDDLGCLRGQRDPAKRYEDLLNNRPSWVWAWLAEDLSATRFEMLQQQAQAVVDGADPEQLAQAMLEALGTRGQEHIRTCLQQAFQQLSDAVGPHVRLSEVHQELARLEASYG